VAVSSFESPPRQQKIQLHHLTGNVTIILVFSNLTLHSDIRSGLPCNRVSKHFDQTWVSGFQKCKPGVFMFGFRGYDITEKT